MGNALTCRTNFWSMYFLAMLGWNSWLSKKRMKNSYTNCGERRGGGGEWDHNPSASLTVWPSGRPSGVEKDSAPTFALVRLLPTLCSLNVFRHKLQTRRQTPYFTTTSWLKFPRETRVTCCSAPSSDPASTGTGQDWTEGVGSDRSKVTDGGQSRVQ